MNENAVPDVVCDTGPLIHLSELGCLDLLEGFARIVIPESVRLEAEKHRPEAVAILRQRAQIWTEEVPSTPRIQSLAELFSLHPAETQCLALCRTLPNALLLTDDAAARLAARALGVRAHGTIGVLLRSARRKTKSRDEVVVLLERMPSCCSLHIRPALLQDIVTEVRSGA